MTVTVLDAISAFTSGSSGPFAISDSANVVAGNLKELSSIEIAGDLASIWLTDSYIGILAIPFQDLTDLALNAIQSSYKLELDGATVEDATSTVALPHVGSFAIYDTVLAVSAGIDFLQRLASVAELVSVTFVGGGTTPGGNQYTGPLMMSLSSYQNDQAALAKIQGGYGIELTAVTVQQALQFSSASNVVEVSISDGALQVVDNLTALSKISVESIHIADSAANIASVIDQIPFSFGVEGVSVSITDSGVATLSITAAETRSAVLGSIQGDFVLSVDASAPNSVVQGLSNWGHGTIVKLPDVAADYAVEPLYDATNFLLIDTGGRAAGTDQMSFVNELQFADYTAIIAQQPGTTQLTTGNVAELYAAVLDREPDVAGLAFYQDALVKQGASLTATRLAEYFLQSPEYTSNPAHDYARSADGDAQFVADLYANLLHRAPDAGAVAYYQSLIAQFTGGLTPGTTAYAAAQLQGHAQVLVYFSASAEFLSDVQIQEGHSADAQHWLYLA